MKNLTKISIITLLTLFISNCGDKVREEITERYDDGKKKTIMKFKGSGSEEVMVEKISYSQSGDTLIWENYNSKGERDGNWIGYVDNSFVEGYVKTIPLTNNDSTIVWNGKYTIYYENGKIWGERNFKDGKLEGKYTYYYENGKIRVEGNHKDGEEDGKWTRYYENGQISSEGNYKDGKIDGKWTLYYENGQISSEGNYKDGEMDGRGRGYYENGKIMIEGNHKDGKIDGKQTYYNEDGSIKKVEEYKDGELVE